LTHSGRLTHKVVTRQPWIRRRSGKVRRLQTDILTTEPRRQSSYPSDINASCPFTCDTLMWHANRRHGKQNVFSAELLYSSHGLLAVHSFLKPRPGNLAYRFMTIVRSLISSSTERTAGLAGLRTIFTGSSEWRLGCDIAACAALSSSYGIRGGHRTSRRRYVACASTGTDICEPKTKQTRNKFVTD